MKKMKMLFHAMLAVTLFFALAACASTGGAGAGISLEDAIEQAAVELETGHAPGVKIAVVSIASNSIDLSDYIIEELIGKLVKGKKLVVVDRQHLQDVLKELNFQMSGYVSDESAQSIGRMLGAQAVITAECKAAFDDLEAKMRDMKKRYFLKPPLEDSDFISLSLSPPGRIPTPHPVPSLKPDTDAAPSGKGKHTVTAINPQTEDKKKPDLVTGVAFASKVRNAGKMPAAFSLGVFALRKLHRPVRGVLGNAQNSEAMGVAHCPPSEYQTNTVKVFQYPEADYGKVADYATAYEAGGGKRGPWSDVVSEIIA